MTPGKAAEFPQTEYDENPSLPFSVSFVSPRTVRLRLNSRAVDFDDSASLMFADGQPAQNNSWEVAQTDQKIVYTGEFGKVRIVKNPWRVEFYDQKGKLLTRTQNVNDPHTYIQTTPFSFVRRASDVSRRFAATFELQHYEKIFGTGESFTRLNKRGQKINVFTRDAMGVQSQLMYKPIPFFFEQQQLRHVRSHERAADI